MAMDFLADNAMAYFEGGDGQFAAADVQNDEVSEPVGDKACTEKTVITDFVQPSSVKCYSVEMGGDGQFAATDVQHDEVSEPVGDKACMEKTVMTDFVQPSSVKCHSVETGIGHVCCSACSDLSSEYFALKSELDDEVRKAKEVARQLVVCEVITRNMEELVMESRKRLIVELHEVEKCVEGGKLDSNKRAELKQILKALRAEIVSESLREMQF